MHLSNEVSTLYYHVIQDTRTLNAQFLVYNEVISEEVLDRLLNLDELYEYLLGKILDYQRGEQG